MKHLTKAALLFGTVLLCNTPIYAQQLEISASNELVWDQTKGLYEANGAAKAIRGAQSIEADILKAYYDATSTSQDITRIIATTNVSFADADMTGSGARLDYNVQKDFYELNGPKAVIRSADGTARAENSLTYNKADGIITATDKAEITLADGRLLKGNTLEIVLGETDEIDTVTATGNVYVRQQDGKEAFSQTGFYSTVTGKALLTGDVKIIDGESVLNGQKAEIDFNKGISKLIAEEGQGRVSGILTSAE